MATSQLSDCTFSGQLGNCHQTTWTHGKSGLLLFSSVPDSERKLILWRSHIENPGDQADICLHHQKALSSKYSVRQTNCCDPFKRHKKVIKASLRVVSEELATKLNVKPGQKICPSCVKQPESTDAMSADTDTPDIEEFSAEEDQLNESLEPLGISPVKMHGIAQKSRVAYAKRKVKSVESSIVKKLSKTLQVPSQEIFQPSEEENCTTCRDLSTLMEELKMKCAVSPRQEKVRILTLVPSSWTIEKTAQEFNVSHYLIRKARKLKEKSGVLADPSIAKGKKLPVSTLEAVKAFYQDDEYSRMCPGKKDFVSVKSDTGRIHKQKLLLLTNMKELYLLFKEKCPEHKVGFSKFCEFRPAWCVTVDSKSALSVCVCETHQNMKLLVDALPGRLEYKELLKTLVCDIDSRECMLQQCDQCPGKQALENFLKNIFEQRETDMEDNITYKQWAHGGQCKLQTLISTVQEFVTLLVDKAKASTVHHHTAKSQAANLRELKESLDTESVVVLLDFAENYSFVCQDAIQSFHWDTAQATLHPFVIYYREEANGDLKCYNLCIISDDRNHSAYTVHYFVKLMMAKVKVLKPNLSKVFYYSDGAASQYKNCKNMRNLCFHEQDFGVMAEWNFFATSHGKSPCDGIGGTVKRLAARSSLHAATTGHVLTPLSLFEFASTNITGINFVFAKSEDIVLTRKH